MGLIDVRELAYTFDSGNSAPRISFSVEPGAAVWVTGRSGLGKTTLLRCLARLQPIRAADVTLRGVSWKDISPIRWRKDVAYLHQEPALFPGSVRHNLSRAFDLHVRAAQAFDPARAVAYLTRLRLPEETMDRDALTLSVGEGARVALVRALMVNPAFLLLDEPSAALDAASRDALSELLLEWLAGSDRGVLGTTHDRELIQALPGREIVLGENGGSGE